ncbi:disease resistance protein RPM1 [Manihot esculenta]|uniref:Uncharacterized protein n=1 Tax=Manihot esculenta TaxID=3983 RepID=A0ACB7IEE0_MANES|nr:disease resistance protein RPM1 [Manihot esculenta]KAG8662850.1 hypothetical protein MANES_01G152200v8 [Manihot esculenta]
MPLFFYHSKSDATVQELYTEMPSETKQAPVIPSCEIEQHKGETSSLAASKSNYENLPHYLKSCLDYFYTLPNMEKGKLVRLLLAQGLIPEKLGEIMEDTAVNMIKELISLGMLQERYEFYSEMQVSEFYIKSCLVKVEEEKDFVSKAANSPIHAFIENDGQDLPPTLKCLLIQSLFASVEYCGGHTRAFSPACLRTVCVLQFLLALNLDGGADCLPDELGVLVHLKYLELRNTNIKKLPRTIANLQKLQTLHIVRCSKLFQLPGEILNIKQLRHLLLCDIIEYRGGIRVPRGIGTLDVSEDHAGELFASVRKLENLVSLSINAEEAGGTLLPDLEAFSPPPHLQELSLAGGLIEMPSWLPSIENLSSLALCHSNLLENSSLVLQFLPKLKHLNLWETYNAKIIGKEFCEAGGFPELETLIIASGDLVEWTEIVNGAFPSLRNLQLWNCLELRFLPEGLQNITTIKELFLTHLHGDLERRLSGEENYKIKHISKFSWDMPIS